jgi:predicted transcriptional regulator
MIGGIMMRPRVIPALNDTSDRRQKVRNYLQETGTSQASFAKLIGLSESYLSRWMKGDLENDEPPNKKVDEFFEKRKALI